MWRLAVFELRFLALYGSLDKVVNPGIAAMKTALEQREERL